MPVKLETARSLRARITELHNQEVITDQLRQWLLVEAKVVVNGMRFVRGQYDDWLDPFLLYPRRIYVACHADNRHRWEDPDTIPTRIMDLVSMPGGASQYTVHECERCDSFRITYCDHIGKRVGSPRYVHAEGYMPEVHEKHQLPWPSVWGMVMRYIKFLDRISGLENMMEHDTRDRHPTARPTLRAV